jgi:predicted acyltransferase
VRGLVVAGLAALALGLAMHRFFMPINKNLWTPSYAVFMAGWSLIAFAVFHALMDAASSAAVRSRARRLALPLTIFGMNALFIFAFSGLVARLLGVRLGAEGATLKASLYAPFRALPLSAENASLAWALAFSACMFAVAWFMWRKRWFIKA